MQRNERLPILGTAVATHSKPRSKIASQPLDITESNKNRVTWWQNSDIAAPSSPLSQFITEKMSGGSPLQAIQNESSSVTQQKQSHSGNVLNLTTKSDWSQPLNRLISNIQQIHGCFSDAILQVERNNRKKLAKVLRRVQSSLLQQFENLLGYVSGIQDRYKLLRDGHHTQNEERIVALENENKALRQELQRANGIKDAKIAMFELEKRKVEHLEHEIEKLKIRSGTSD